MSKQKYYVVEVQPDESYAIEHVYQDGVLRRANSSNWAPHVVGKVSSKITDTGDGVILTLEDSTNIVLDYCELASLYSLLLAFHQDNQKTFGRIGLMRPVTKSKKG